MFTIYQKFNEYIRNTKRNEQPKELEIQFHEFKDNVSIISLPTETMFHIFSYLSLKDLCNCSLVSERWSNICDDLLLWKYITSIESLNWVGILPRNSIKNNYIHPKDIYLSITPIYNLSSIELIRSGFLIYLSLFLKSYLGHKSPNIAVMGSGLDNFRTKSLFDDMFHNKCSDFEPIGQFMPSVGSGITMKLLSNDNYSYKFHFFLLYSLTTKKSYNNILQEQRIRTSILFNKLKENEHLEKLQLSIKAKDIFSQLQGLIYAIDGQDNEMNYQTLVYEFKVAIKSIPIDIPVLLILINTNKNKFTSMSTFQIVQLFDLLNLSNPWCILIASVRDIHVVKLGIIWIIQNNKK